jgi:sporulation protein YlmC with PRC-barrel domain
MLKQLGFGAALLGGTLVMTPAMAQQTSGDPFIKQQEINQWRASKLVGVAVMGADQKKIGKIADVLVDHDGNAQTIVISVGGFLGIGSKDVAVPFKTMKWQTEGRSVAAGPPAASTTGGAPATVKTDPAATEANQGYPDVAMLDMTKAQLQSAPDFRYAPDPAAHSALGQSDKGAPAPAPNPASTRND